MNTIGTTLLLLVFLSGPLSVSANSSELDISQYSDRYITSNAKMADPSYAHIAFNPVPHNERGFRQNSQVASIMRALSFFFAKDDMGDKTLEHGTWLWTPIMQMSPEYMSTIINSAREEQINTIYLSLDSYLDIFTLADDEEKVKQTEAFTKQLELFLWFAHEQGIKVDAEAGWRNWAEPGHTYKAFAIVDFVKKYNLAHDHKFRGFQYDVEPYLLDEFKLSDLGKTIVLQRFLKLVSETQEFLSDSDMKFSIVIPDFYDGRDKVIPKFEFGGYKDFAFGHIMRILEYRRGGSVIIMSYRNFAKGKDGSIDVSKNEMRTARSGYYSTEVILAQETGDVPPPYITFFNTSKFKFGEETEVLANAFLSHRNFGGLAIHYANAYFDLK